MRYLTVIEKGKHNHSAYAPDVPGVVATGKTLEATMQAISEALAVQLEGESFPKAKTQTREDAARHAKKVLGEELGTSDVVTFVSVAPMNPVSLEVERLIEQSGLTQSEIAKRMGTTQSVVSRLANPFYWNHSLSSLDRLAKSLGKTVELRYLDVA